MKNENYRVIIDHSAEQVAVIDELCQKTSIRSRAALYRYVAGVYKEVLADLPRNSAIQVPNNDGSYKKVIILRPFG